MASQWHSCQFRHPTRSAAVAFRAQVASRGGAPPSGASYLAALQFSRPPVHEPPILHPMHVLLPQALLLWEVPTIHDVSHMLVATASSTAGQQARFNVVTRCTCKGTAGTPALSVGLTRRPPTWRASPETSLQHASRFCSLREPPSQ
jgi:hypothetical protein